MVAKVAKRMQGLQGKLVSYGGKSTLIKPVLHAPPLHLIAAVYPPKTVFYQIEKIIFDFCWAWTKINVSYIGFPGKIYVFRWRRKVWGSGRSMIFVRPFLERVGGNSELRIHFSSNSRKLNIIENFIQLLRKKSLVNLPTGKE